MAEEQKAKISNLKNVFKSIKKYGFKETMKEWSELTSATANPISIVNSNIVGNLFVLAGALTGLYFVFFLGYAWFFGLFCGGAFILTLTQLRGLMEQRTILKSIEEERKNIGEIKNEK